MRNSTAPSCIERLSAPMAMMRRASRPSGANVGTRSSSAISSWIVICRTASRHQLVAAGVGDKDRRVGRIALDLLPQAVNVRLERMCGHAGIVAPDFLQQDLARDRALAGAVQITQDCRLFLGEPDLAAFRIEQKL